MVVRVPIKRVGDTSDLSLPAYQSENAAGMDICAAVSDSTIVKSGEIVAIPCGFALAIPIGYEGQIRPRSGLAAKYGITIGNAPGTIDSDYRGEIAVLLHNTSRYDFTVKRGMRIAQLLILPVPVTEWQEVSELPLTSRGAGGFGNSGE
jgi:dUTP pyrophosphatase